MPYLMEPFQTECSLPNWSEVKRSGIFSELQTNLGSNSQLFHWTADI